MKTQLILAIVIVLIAAGIFAVKLTGSHEDEKVANDQMATSFPDELTDSDELSAENAEPHDDSPQKPQLQYQPHQPKR